MIHNDNIWLFQRALSRRLMRWAAVSTLVGVPLLILRPFWRGVGGQFIGWGLIDGGIALFGSAFSERRRVMLFDPLAADVQTKERRTLRRLLWINVGLDLLYMVAGRRLTRSAREYRRGMGWGIALQGAFLFMFDLFHARALRDDRTTLAEDGGYV